MIEKIFSRLKSTDFDFRKYAPAHDSLSHLFPEWVRYYQLKYAIAEIIKPAAILETGVRYGYSAITFLEASPEASYTGIDIDCAEFGGEKGAIEWAKKITRPYKAEFIIADTTKMTSFPGDFYDLIHVDAQQDGDGTFGDLKKALEKGRYILVDGYFWSKQNMLSSTYFLEKYKEFIEYALIVPGYAGELLIKTKPSARHIFSRQEEGYKALADSYDSNYYLNDCGGYDAFKRTKGTEITDVRLLAPIYLAMPDRKKNILDIGFGRGELAYALSKSSLKVTGLDYSKDAVEIAQKAFRNVDNLSFIYADILEFDTEEKFDVILATDVIEHIEQPMLLKMFKKVKTLLSKNGVFIVHTAPNKLNYMYGYSGQYKKAKEIGVYIPENPRTYYEDIMHINEQTPASLHRGLRSSFNNVVVWTASMPDLLGDLGRAPDKKTLSQNNSIFAVCSSKILDVSEIEDCLTQKELHVTGLNVKIKLLDTLNSIEAGETVDFKVKVSNYSGQRLSSLQPYPINLAYHWVSADAPANSILDGIRTPLGAMLLKNSDMVVDMRIKAPVMPGKYILEVTMVQEGQFWLEQFVPSLPVKLGVTVYD